jgi:hypothetical protein
MLKAHSPTIPLSEGSWDAIVTTNYDTNVDVALYESVYDDAYRDLTDVYLGADFRDPDDDKPALSDPAKTIQVARMAVESGLFPFFEAEGGEVTDRTPIRRQVPVDRYLQVQGRFRHLFEPRRDEAGLQAIQALADRNIRIYRLMEDHS